MKFGFGSWRFFLAFLVVISHLWSHMLGGPAAYAVWGFFVLSGFLMTHVLCHKYGYTQEGLRAYTFNRFIRIFPAYGVACILGLVTLLTLPRLGITPSLLNPQFVMPVSMHDWLINLTLLPLGTSGPLLVPVAGALVVEVGVYLLIPLMAFSRAAAWLGFILSLALNMHYGFDTGTFAERYSLFLTCFGVFALGSLTCHYKTWLKKIEAPVFSVLVWVFHSIVAVWYDLWPWTYGLYSSALLSAWVTLSLAPLKVNRLDNILGNLSYPVYLFHTTVAVWMMLLLHKNQNHTFKLFLLSFAATLLLSQLVIMIVDSPYLKRLKKAPPLESLEKSSIKSTFTVEPNDALVYAPKPLVNRHLETEMA